MVQVFLEDAGFDWKVLGPDVSNIDYVSWVCDQDAYACSGQKCSAQSMLFVHKNWSDSGKSFLCQCLHLQWTEVQCRIHAVVHIGAMAVSHAVDADTMVRANASE